MTHFSLGRIIAERHFRIGALMAVLVAANVASGPPASGAPPIEAYGKLPGINNVSLSPSGDKYALVNVEGEKHRLLVLSLEDKELAAADLGRLKVREVSWAGEDHVLITTSATVNLGLGFAMEKDELETVIVLNVSTGKALQVFGPAHSHQVANTVMGSFGTAQIDGHWYGWFGGITYQQSGEETRLEVLSVAC